MARSSALPLSLELAFLSPVDLFDDEFIPMLPIAIISPVLTQQYHPNFPSDIASSSHRIYQKIESKKSGLALDVLSAAAGRKLFADGLFKAGAYCGKAHKSHRLLRRAAARTGNSGDAQSPRALHSLTHAASHGA